MLSYILLIIIASPVVHAFGSPFFFAPQFDFDDDRHQLSCPDWSDWVNSTECLLPPDVDRTVSSMCPDSASAFEPEFAPRRIHKRSIGSFPFMFPDMFPYQFQSQSQSFPGHRSVWYQSHQQQPIRFNEHNPWEGQEPVPVPVPEPGRPQRYGHRSLAAPRRYLSPLMASRRRGAQRRQRPSPIGRPRTMNPWNNIFTECGRCAVEVQCRRRPEVAGCGQATLDVRRTTCSAFKNKIQPACQLPPRTCAAINRTQAASLLPYHSRSSAVFRDRDAAAQFNCASSRKACVCCCKPYIAVDGLCVAPEQAKTVHQEPVPDLQEPAKGEPLESSINDFLSRLFAPTSKSPSENKVESKVESKVQPDSSVTVVPFESTEWASTADPDDTAKTISLHAATTVTTTMPPDTSKPGSDEVCPISSPEKKSTTEKALETEEEHSKRARIQQQGVNPAVSPKTLEQEPEPSLKPTTSKAVEIQDAQPQRGNTGRAKVNSEQEVLDLFQLLNMLSNDHNLRHSTEDNHKEEKKKRNEKEKVANAEQDPNGLDVRKPETQGEEGEELLEPKVLELEKKQKKKVAEEKEQEINYVKKNPEHLSPFSDQKQKPDANNKEENKEQLEEFFKQLFPRDWFYPIGTMLKQKNQSHGSIADSSPSRDKIGAKLIKEDLEASTTVAPSTTEPVTEEPTVRVLPLETDQKESDHEQANDHSDSGERSELKKEKQDRVAKTSHDGDEQEGPEKPVEPIEAGLDGKNEEKKPEEMGSGRKKSGKDESDDDEILNSFLSGNLFNDFKWKK